MGRWDVATHWRLANAATELFEERGYDAVTATHIAERAGVTRRSYFRYYADKREVMFAGTGQTPPELYQAVRAVCPGTPPLATALEALARVGSLLIAHQRNLARRRALIEAIPELKERDRTKLAELAEVVCAALTHRGADEDTARIVAQIALVAYENALARWLKAEGREDFASCIAAAATTLQAAVPGTAHP
ncbi:TetR/AcrR family transcriptional regulator [Streptomyces cavernicola]|uniref:Helix-turn-helix domain-containing protein n=1 Tax=Streptomyces cavernicola TaxID=3043613 RepID=A0ABT6SM59_9ACTN|nr:TetR/AcrR family transcriptional regulator [Streptomyces sp. B-S-A6]MDI3409258.1 helix-turn-helix domain-containing protein [Streptomyces sp. B-S-A6]